MYILIGGTMEKVSCEYKILNVPQEADSSDKPWITSWRVVNVIMSVFFLLSAYVQVKLSDHCHIDYIFYLNSQPFYYNYGVKL